MLIVSGHCVSAFNCYCLYLCECIQLLLSLAVSAKELLPPNICNEPVENNIRNKLFTIFKYTVFVFFVLSN